MMNIFYKNKHKYTDLKTENKDFNSISFLIKRQLSQSQYIRFGLIIEKYLIDLIESETDLKNIKEKNKKNERERDHLFQDEKNKIIYYAEIKSNINLDTEKSKETCNKCLENLNKEQIKYPNYNVNMYLVCN